MKQKNYYNDDIVAAYIAKKTKTRLQESDEPSILDKYNIKKIEKFQK